MDNPLQERLSEPAALGARRVALGMVDTLEKANDRRGATDNSEALHDMRVAMRRLRSWLVRRWIGAGNGCDSYAEVGPL